jgi:hypothetical protein
MGQDYIDLPMEIFIKGLFQTEQDKEKEFTYGVIKASMKENGAKIKCMVVANIQLLMEMNLMANSEMMSLL